METFEERVVVVTGGADGIGLSVVESFLAKGATVCCLDIDANKLDRIKSNNSSSKLKTINVDVTKPSMLCQTFKIIKQEYSRIDILVNCAGGFYQVKPIWELTFEEWEEVINLNLNSAFLCMQNVIPLMIKQNWGRILNFSSSAGRSPVGASVASYAAAKAGILGLTKYGAKELGPYGITVNALAPGTILTPRVKKNKTEQDLAKVIEITPIKRLGLPEDCAEIVLFLASEKAGFINGATIDVNGGRVLV